MYFYTHFSQLFVLEVVAVAVCLGPYTRSRRRLRGHTHGAAYVDTFTPPLTWTRSRRLRGHIHGAVHVDTLLSPSPAVMSTDRSTSDWLFFGGSSSGSSVGRRGGGGEGLLTDDTASSTSVPVYG